MNDTERIHDSVLGELVRVPSLTVWKGQTSLLGNDNVGIMIELHVEGDIQSGGMIDECVAFLREMVAFAESNDDVLRGAIANNLLGEYNEKWKWPAEEQDLSHEQFVQCLSLSGIRIHGPFEGRLFSAVSYETTGLFGERLPIVHLLRDMRIDGVTLE